MHQDAVCGAVGARRSCFLEGLWLSQGQYCDICTAANSNKAHPVSNAVDGTERWWQSPPLSRGLEYNEVNVTLDLGQVFHVAYVLIKFANSPRPDLWVLERSVDFGHTYQPWQFFASSRRDCLERFGVPRLERITQDDDVICSTEYSRIVPLENGEVVVSLVNGRPGAMNFSYSPLLRDFTKATNIRLRFLRTNTLLGHLMGKALRDPTVTRRYYYSIKDISIGGRCVCHGHADVCDPVDPADPFSLWQLECACQHNTCGGSCERCCPGFNQQQWKPATPESANECQSCNCHGHADDCYYDPEVDRHNASQNQDSVYQGGGVCIACQHHTTGINCERCLPGFYRDPDQPLDSPHTCRRCNCESNFTDGTCEDLTGRCYCRPSFAGERCEACAAGLTGFPHCYSVSAPRNSSVAQVQQAGQIVSCDCNAGGTQNNACQKDPQLGRCLCKPNFQGIYCELCAPGFYGQDCHPCQCSSPGVVDGDCDRDSGQCTCRAGFQGATCDRCAPGYFHFPLCQCEQGLPMCGCSTAGTLPQGCDEAGHCLCRPEFDGPHCDRCRPGHHGYPDCRACDCDPQGALDQLCSVGGVCRCRPGFAGATCRECSPGFHGFPTCAPCHCSAHGSLDAACDPRSGQCSCRPRVTGLRCDTCVPGTYNFPYCEGCNCDPRGTLGGAAECELVSLRAEGNGQCFCKPRVCGQACAVCKDGFFGLGQAGYFGCRSCRCDVGGALGQGCEPRTGACRCRPNTHGPTCSEPAPEHYLPDLHHLRLELEEAATPEGHAVRFGFNPLEFENFSWRGYAQMAPIQPRIVARLNVTSPDLFWLVFRYVNRGPLSVSGRVSVQEEGKFATCANCTEQSQPVAFPPSTEPAFVTVPQRGFGEPFVLNPGTWALLVEAEGVLLPLAVCQGNDVDVQLQVAVPRPGRYALVAEYANAEAHQEVGVAVHTPQRLPQQGALTLLPCLYSTLCRGTALDEQHHLVAFHLGTEASVRLTAQQAHFYLHSITLVPMETFSLEFVEPRVRCVSSHGAFSPSSAACLPSRFPKPPQPTILRDCLVLPLPPGLPLTHSQELTPGAPPSGPQPRPPTAVDPDAEPTLLRHPQGTVIFTTHVPALGRYAFLLHGYQPAHPTFAVEVLVNGGRIWQGHANATFCPHGYGCRSLVVCEGQAILDVTDSELTVTVRVPEGRWLWVEYVLVVPEDAYSSSYLQEEPLDKSYDFISQCATHGYHISPTSSSQFCRDAATSLSLFYNNGARPCGCHEVGATSPACESYGGQCPCRPHVIGRDCSRCATGYWGFPSCRRVCDPLTGQCHCKENVQGPRCDQCRLGTFSLDAANPKGCTRCFCFGATERCGSSVHTRQEFVDMEGWMLLSSDRQVVPHELRAETGLLHADLQHVPETIPELYWHAPPSYLGDRVSSYGGTLRYELHAESQRGDVFLPTESRPDVLLQVAAGAGNQMSIMFLEPGHSAPGHVHQGRLQLVEGNFRHTETHSAVSREELMMVLAGLQQLQIRALFSKFSRAVSLGKVALEVASKMGGGPLASNVELCMCPANYLGDSCQECAPGYYRDIKGLFLGRCIPCQCHGHSDLCIPGVGTCMDCQHNTEGDHCERCQAGFVRIGTEDPAAPCVSCPCPVSPVDIIGGRPQCLCKPGYAGASCERCAPGFFGNPLVLGSSCQPCNCSGNGDPNMIFKDCDPLTGACHSCLRHTTGPHCETCAPGFYGNALLPGNCTRCQCQEGHCDVHTGRCTCPPGLSGERCDTCSHQHQVLVPGGPGSGGVHCEVCDHCVVLLLDDLERAGTLLPAIREQLRGVNTSSLAWARLHRLNASISDLQATGARVRAGQLLDGTEATLGRAQALLKAILALDRTLSELMTDHLSPGNASAPSGEQLRQTLAKVDRLLGEMRARDLGAPRAVAEAELDEAQRLLARVQEQLTSRWEGNQALAARTRDQLAQHEAGLMDLREALNRAVSTTREAEELNSRNQERLEEALHWKQELLRDNATLRDTLQAASDTLARVSELLHGMDRAKEEYEHLAASLDGAWTPLLEKIRAFSPASGKVDLVEAAEAHARQLDQLAHNLSSIIRGVNQDRFIQRAIEAANAYSSILRAVQAAEGAAGQALQQAGHTGGMAVQQGLAPRARELRANSSALEQAVLREQQRLGRVRATLQGTGTQLRDTRAKKEQLAARVQEVQAMLAMDTDETSKKIAHAKAVATRAQDTAARVQSRLRDMQRNLEQWQGQYGGLQSQDLGQVVLDAGRSVSTLEKTLPQLLAKLNLLENRGGHNASLALSASIGRVRELIAQARGAASKVKVSMKFNGRSGVQLRAPRDLADLAAYTALKFYLQSPEPTSDQVSEDQFVLYMGSRQATGDYMGVALRNQKVHWVYRLGDAGPATLSIDENIGEEFAAISLERTLQFGHMSVTVEKQMSHETKGDTVAPGAEGLLSLQPDDFVFYVGGYPSNFTPPEPLRFPRYRGCIEMGTLNEAVVSLYDFEKTFQLNTAVDKPCARTKSTGDPWLTDGSYLEGSGFARIKVESQISHTKRFEQELRLVSYSRLVLLYDFGEGLQEAKPIQPPPPLTVASKAIQVFLLGDSRKRVLVRVERATVFSVEQENVLELANAYYLGGAPPDRLPPSLRQLFPSGGSVRGCIKGIKALGKYVDLKRLNTTGISAGCTADLLVGRAMTFHGHGFLPLELPDVAPLTSSVYSGFGFRSTQDSGLLYHRASPVGPCEVSLQQGHVNLRFVTTEAKTPGGFADGFPHYVAFYSNTTGVWLYVDDQLQQMKPHQGPPPRPQPQPQPEGPHRLLLGGLGASNTIRNFSGCITNVFVQRLMGPQRVLDLQQNVGGINVSSGCAPAAPGTQTPVQAPRGLQATMAQKVSRHTRQPAQDSACTPPRPLGTIHGTYQFGGPLSSYLEFTAVLAPFENWSHFSMVVRPRTRRGLLLLAVPLAAGSPSLALFLSHRYFVAQTQGPGPELRVLSHQRSKANQWHKVSVRWARTRIQLQVDGVWTQSQEQPGQEPGQQYQGAEGPQPYTLFVGGLPVHGPKLPMFISSSWFSGCVRRLMVDGQALSTPSRMVGVTPCLSEPLETGLFFAGSKGAITLDTLGTTLPDVSLRLEVRPQTATGLIFHLGQFQVPPYLELRVLEKQVLLWADDGAGKFSTSVALSKELCDGQWHQLAVTKSKTALWLEVDSRSNQTLGPMLQASDSTPVPLHLGGLPGPLDTQAGHPTPTHPWPPFYQGCMRNLMVNGAFVTLPRSAGVQGAVGASGCPAT
ncbi:Laminin subunit alpha-5 [Myotis davidii]|uniref:Laminin subunit alpha-5 n=1 Tax=Myotis davidii TaxID=225400 RepID=L5LIL2_MYODS|nr:Laminin subunit alpha-5 [Myotis davidii]